VRNRAARSARAPSSARSRTELEPVEINAGTWYLRALRADDRIDDRPAILASGRCPEPTLEAAGAYVARSAAGWERDECCSWAVCEPTTGEMLGEVDLSGLDLERGVAELRVWTLPGARRRGLATAAVSSVVRFGFGGLGLQRVTFRWATGDDAAEALARRCGFVADPVPGGSGPDVYVASRLATDR
jgi:RimJ/RimL family protein N-acetyltransferase